MKPSHRVLCAVCVLSHPLSLCADFVVGAGESVAVTNTESLSLSMASIQLGPEATLVFADASAGVPGLSEYVRTNATSYGVPGVAAYSNWVRCATDAYWATTNIMTAQTEYIYTARWRVPEAGTYSFYENIDDGAAIAVDGVTLVQNSTWNVETCTRDVALGAGWHDLEIRVQNGAGTAAAGSTPR